MSDEMTARLADALFRIDTDRDNPGGLAGRSYEDIAAALLPVVRELMAGVEAERDALRAKVAAVLAYCEEIDRARTFPGLADTDAIRRRLSALNGEAASG